jgi:hypothetical protein
MAYASMDLLEIILEDQKQRRDMGMEGNQRK